MERVEYVLDQFRNMISAGTSSEKAMVAGGYIIGWIRDSRQKNKLTLEEVHDLMADMSCFFKNLKNNRKSSKKS